MCTKQRFSVSGTEEQCQCVKFRNKEETPTAACESDYTVNQVLFGEEVEDKWGEERRSVATHLCLLNGLRAKSRRIHPLLSTFAGSLVRIFLKEMSGGVVMGNWINIACLLCGSRECVIW